MPSMMQGLMGAMAGGAGSKANISTEEGVGVQAPGVDMGSVMQGLMGSMNGASGGSGIDMASMIQGLVSSSMGPVDEVVSDNPSGSIQEITRASNKDLDVE